MASPLPSSLTYVASLLWIFEISGWWITGVQSTPGRSRLFVSLNFSSGQGKTFKQSASEEDCLLGNETYFSRFKLFPFLSDGDSRTFPGMNISANVFKKKNLYSLTSLFFLSSSIITLHELEKPLISCLIIL